MSSSVLTDSLGLLLRRAEDGEEAAPACETGNGFDGSIGLRVSALFVILITSSFGAVFPVVARSTSRFTIPAGAFFFVKYFGSGVIIATAFIHLLTPANEALTNPCLTGTITEYPWAQGIALMSVFTLFFVELLAMRYATFANFAPKAGMGPAGFSASSTSVGKAPPAANPGSQPGQSHEMEPHLSHVVDHADPESSRDQSNSESYAAQVTSLFILEFGVIFHSVFIGLTLAVAGSEFKTLYVVLVFHQMFEGLGLGARLATVPWPQSKHLTPYIMGIAYGLSTPTAIAIGLGFRESYSAEGATTLIANGIFDALSAGILLYTGLVELMAHEFLFSHSLRDASTATVLSAFGIMVLGAALMSLLGKWA